MNTRYFRAGVGTIIYNQTSKQVLLFERAQNPIDVWQFQQGGIDNGEEQETTLWRELAEEVGLTESDFLTITPYGKWTIHPYPPELVNKPGNKEPDRLGQAHTWYFLELKPEVEIDLNKATDQEFSAFKWVDFAKAVEQTADYKRPVYAELQQFFIKMI